MTAATPMRNATDGRSANGSPLSAPQRLDPALWERPEIRAVLAVRDITSLFRQLGQHRISQRRIATLVAISQSEVSEIAGGRQVRFYDLLARISDGLGIPRSYLGLADQPTRQAATTQDDANLATAASETHEPRQDGHISSAAGRRKSLSRRDRRRRVRRRHAG
jgi:transcriptional regulator with XRE-family HTH domain